MPRLIDANEALELFRVNYANTERLIKLGETQLDSLAEGYTEAAHIIKHILPSVDAVPVVRCKDCKHFNFEHMECENEAVSTDHEGGASYSLNFYLDDFCSYGERKEKNNDTD